MLGDYGCPITEFYLGHFAEWIGEHYVCLMEDGQETYDAEMPLYNGLPFPPNEQNSDNPKRLDCNEHPINKTQRINTLLMEKAKVEKISRRALC